MFSCFSWFSWFLCLRRGLGALGCFAVDTDFLYSLHPDYHFLLSAFVFMLFLVFMICGCPERPGRRGLLSRGQRCPVIPDPDYYFLRVACVFLIFRFFWVFVFTERPGRRGLLRRGQRYIPCIQIIISCSLLVFFCFS